jgi:hypothetical protein
MLPPRKLRQPSIVVASPRNGILKMLFCELAGHARSVPAQTAHVVRGLCHFSLRISTKE